MSGFISTVAANFGDFFGYRGFMNCNLETSNPIDYRTQTTNLLLIVDNVDFLWPRSSFPGQPNVIWEARHQDWEPMVALMSNGVTVSKKISGITKDANGNVLGNVTIKLFDATTDILIDTQVSNPYDGTFVMNAKTNNNHYLVMYANSTPTSVIPVAGSTANTLVGT